MERHSWTEEEIQICVEAYINGFIKNELEVKEVVKSIINKAPILKEKSIILRLQNIKFILSNELDVKDKFKHEGKEHYSKDTKRVLIEILKKNNIIT